MANFQIPSELEKRLFVSDKKLAKKLVATLDNLADLLVGDKLEFFVEYTDHSIEHVNKVLENTEDLITVDTLEKLNSLDSAVLIVAVMLHDIGMKATIELFQNMLNGSYDYGQPGMPKEKNIYNDKPWKELWDDYIKESQFWNAEKKLNVIGESDYIVDRDDLNHKILEDPNGLNGKDKRLIGEFIRRHHGRIAYEVAIRGYWGYNKNRIVLHDALDKEYLQLAGMVARSHSMGLRENYDYLEKISDKTFYKSPYNIDIILHMVVIRLSDYLHIDKDRTNKTVLYLRKTYSPYSLREHQKHLAISNIRFKEEEETISITVNSHIENAELFVSIEQLVNDIQSEFDTCWAVLGEQYSNKYKLKYRRITSNLSQDGEFSVKNIQEYVPKQFGFKFNNSLLELLIAPLYGDNPSFGVRELVQNAVDACRTRMLIDQDYYAKENYTHVTVSLDPETKLFRIVDTGIGMNIEEIEKYFLTIGSSYSRSIDWQKTRDNVNKDSNNKFYRTGRFGVGILAAFLLGPIIKVKTKRINSEQGYQFTLRLDKNFIQIDKVDLPDYGTTIEITCNENALKRLLHDDPDYWYLGNDMWFGWYIDSKPKVDYILKGQSIHFKKEWKEEFIDYINSFRLLPTESRNVGKVYWKPHDLFKCFEDHCESILSSGSPRLFCNGFWVTNRSDKARFSIQGLETYFPFGIPDLMIIDAFNCIPLNLNRTNIDENVEYEFEKDLAIASCKDYLCQMVAIDIDSLSSSELLLFNKSGYTIAEHDIISEKERVIKEKILFDKYLVRIYSSHVKGLTRTNGMWPTEYSSLLRSTINAHPEAFFSFICHMNYSDRPLNYSIKRFEKGKLSCIVVDTSNYPSNLSHLKKYINEKANRIYGNYAILGNDSLNVDLINELVQQIDKYNLQDAIMCFSIELVNSEKAFSPLDDFIKEYADGDMIVPYDETERKQKFSKLYEECGEYIEHYKKVYKLFH